MLQNFACVFRHIPCVYKSKQVARVPQLLRHITAAAKARTMIG